MESQSGRKIGLALGGGGARGLAHIGILKVLEREGIHADIIAGTSMGGLVGAAYAAGISPGEMERVAHRWSRPLEMVKLMDPGLIQGAMLKGSRIYRALETLLGKGLRFETLPRQLAVTAADLNSGCEVILKEGLVVDAIRATISFPGVFAPLKRFGLRLVDGGVLNNVPADVVRQMGANLVLAVDVLPEFSQNSPGRPNVAHPLFPPKGPRPLKELWHIQMMMISAATRLRLQASPPDLLMRPRLPAGMDFFAGFSRPAVAIEGGMKEAERMLPRIRSLLDGPTSDEGVKSQKGD